MSLQNELDDLSRVVRAGTSPRLLQVLDHFVEALREQKAKTYGLKTGDTVANVKLQMPHRGRVELYSLLNEGPVILTFYRGGWCPYCNLALKSLRYTLPEIERRGARLIAITPERPESAVQTARKNGIDYPVVHDANSEVARQFGVSIPLSEPLKALYRSLGLNLAARNADVIVRLPLPATFVIGTDYTVRYAFVEEDYTRRAEPKAMLEVLSAAAPQLMQSYG
ncbi:MAG: peroxiredoxin-like family protein [Tunicatimonas sp.]